MRYFILAILLFSGFTFNNVTEVKGTVKANHADVLITTDLPDEVVTWDGDKFSFKPADDHDTSLLKIEINPTQEKYDVKVDAEIITKDGTYTYEGYDAYYRSWYRMRNKHYVYIVSPKIDE